MQYFQQGDVLLKRIDKLPTNLVPLETKTLQRGETTGHSHRFEGNTVRLFSTPDKTLNGMRIHTHDGVCYIEVTQPSALVHEEHKTINVEPGIYEVDLVREYDWESEEMRRVID